MIRSRSTAALLERSVYSSFPDRPLWTANLLTKRRRTAYGGTVGPEGSPKGRRMRPRNEQFFTLFSKAGSNVVDSAVILMEFVAAPHERWAKLAKRKHDTEHVGDETGLSHQGCFRRLGW
jgi:hypothetical protein